MCNALNNPHPRNAVRCELVVVWLIFTGLAGGEAFEIRAAETRMSPSPPPYRTVRYDEDYRYLSDPTNRIDFFDPIKYIPLDKSGSWYASFGGEIRERYEYYENYNWGLGPQDPNGYPLQRYLLSGDLHYGDRFGFSASSWQRSKTGGSTVRDRRMRKWVICIKDSSI